MDQPKSQLLDAFYRGVTDPAELGRALHLAQDMFHCQGGALVVLDAQAPSTALSLTSGLFGEYGRLYAEQFIEIDPAPTIFARLPVGRAGATDRMFTPVELRKLPFVNDFFRRIGLAETLGGNLFSDQARFSLIGLQRGFDRPPFDDDEIAALEALMPHVKRVLQLRRSFVHIETAKFALQEAVDRLAAGIVLFDVDGDAIHANAAMQAIARAADGLTLDRAGRPLIANLAARRRFDALLDDTMKGGAGGVLTVPRASGGRDYAVLVGAVPGSLKQFRWDKSGRAGAIVLVHDPDGRSPTPAAILETALHLPKGAARLVAALAGDGDLKSFAEQESVTIHTARFHLHTALTRTGARTQAELVRIAVRLLRDFALRETRRG
ncbi:MAG: helix-turn-helix transcriptional regulator [Stellaceae bacterium]